MLLGRGIKRTKDETRFKP